jgi:hypothetical protein
MASTKSQIQALISQIYTGANYTASALNSLMNTVLDSVFSPFFSAAAKPGSSDNQTQGFKAGSIGMDTSNSRVYACSTSTDSSATWEQITQDRNVSTIVATTGSSYTLSVPDTYIIYSGSQDGVTVNLPIAINSYLGKIVRVYFSGVTISGSGVEFVVPEPIGGIYTVAAPYVYQNDTAIDFIFNGSVWSSYYSTPAQATLQSAYDNGNTVNSFNITLSNSPSSNVLITNGAYTGNENVIIGTGAGGAGGGNANLILGKLAGNNATGDSNLMLGSGAGFGSSGNNNMFAGTNAGAGIIGGNNNICIGLGAGFGAAGDNNIMLGLTAGSNNTLSNQFIVSNTSLPSFVNNGAALAALSGGASGNTYLYYNSTNFAIEGVRIP